MANGRQLDIFNRVLVHQAMAMGNGVEDRDSLGCFAWSRDPKIRRLSRSQLVWELPPRYIETLLFICSCALDDPCAFYVMLYTVRRDHNHKRGNSKRLRFIKAPFDPVYCSPSSHSHWGNNIIHSLHMSWKGTSHEIKMCICINSSLESSSSFLASQNKQTNNFSASICYSSQPLCITNTPFFATRLQFNSCHPLLAVIYISTTRIQLKNVAFRSELHCHPHNFLSTHPPFPPCGTSLRLIKFMNTLSRSFTKILGHHHHHAEEVGPRSDWPANHLPTAQQEKQQSRPFPWLPPLTYTS